MYRDWTRKDYKETVAKGSILANSLTWTINLTHEYLIEFETVFIRQPLVTFARFTWCSWCYRLAFIVFEKSNIFAHEIIDFFIISCCSVFLLFHENCCNSLRFSILLMSLLRVYESLRVFFWWGPEVFSFMDRILHFFEHHIGHDFHI